MIASDGVRRHRTIASQWINVLGEQMEFNKGDHGEGKSPDHMSLGEASYRLPCEPSSFNHRLECSMLEYFALVILLVGLTLTFYTFVYIHDIPYDIAKHRNHPNKEAIHAACWLSLFTLHAIWPIVFIWALMKQRSERSDLNAEGDLTDKLAVLEGRLAEIEKRNGTGSKRST
jgi:hypothetical protein